MDTTQKPEDNSPLEGWQHGPTVAEFPFTDLDDIVGKCGRKRQEDFSSSTDEAIATLSICNVNMTNFLYYNNESKATLMANERDMQALDTMSPEGELLGRPYLQVCLTWV